MKKKIESIVKKAVGKDADFDILIPEKEEFGHYSTNAALKLAKIEKRPPLEIAGKIVAKIEKTAAKNFFEKIEIAAPGFINFWISKDALRKEFNEIAARPAGARNDRIKGGQFKNKKVIVEFTDPNPFKEFHIGHLYNNIVGESLVRLFEANGANVRRANYQGDVGLHVAKAIWGIKKMMESEGIMLKELERKSLKDRIKFMGKGYAMGDAAYTEESIGKIEITALNKKIFALARPNFAKQNLGGRNPEVKELYQKGRKWSLEYFETIYKRLGTKFDKYYFEREIADRGVEIVKENLKKGIFEESEGAIVFPGEKYGLHTRVFINREGLPTYEAKELSLAPAKYKDFPYDLSVIVTGNEIIEYFKVLLAALKLIAPKLAEKTRHIPHGMVRLPSGKMSSRTGTVIAATDLLDDMKKRVETREESRGTNPAPFVKRGGARMSAKEKEKIAEAVSLGAVKYSLLKVSIGHDIIFDPDTSLSIHGDSGPYIQYTYARLKSILRKAHSLRTTAYSAKNIEGEGEFRLVRKILEFPEVIAEAGKQVSPSIVTKYAYELSDLANKYYESTPILKDKDKIRRAARLALVVSIAETLKSALDLLGIPVPEKI